ncbi:MAG: hypothetical protein A4S09_05430 [Proteobacteria bacterium SG_bin7]|nr:MAG: hypothetical protein A4S09_05430 [Proteobacteria bacterium SG_bin7]
MKNFFSGFTLTFLFIVTSAFTSPTDYKSAIRKPTETWQSAYERHFKTYQTVKGTRPPKNAQEAAVKIDKLDTRVATEWGKSIDLLSLFFSLRDVRFLQTKDDPNFLRRISWLYPDDGCFARAAMMVTKLREDSIPDPSKVFIFGDLNVKTQNSPTGKVSWWYHVAPVVRTGEQVFVLDAAINAYQPLPLLDWVKTMTDDPMRVKLSICKANSYVPSDSCYEPKESDASDAPEDQLIYLNEEWDRNVELGRNARDVLGDNPPWKGKQPL